jgi:hypothetical protein
MESRITKIILALLLFLFSKAMSAVAAEPICHGDDTATIKSAMTIMPVNW